MHLKQGIASSNQHNSIPPNSGSISSAESLPIGELPDSAPNQWQPEKERTQEIPAIPPVASISSRNSRRRLTPDSIPNNSDHARDRGGLRLPTISSSGFIVAPNAVIELAASNGSVIVVGNRRSVRPPREAKSIIQLSARASDIIIKRPAVLPTMN